MNCQILVIDFGSQVTKLIARRVRECGVYCEIKPFNKVTNIFLKKSNFKGFIFSGGPSSVEEKNFPHIKNFIFETNLPILGICYGAQLLTKIFGGKVKNSTEREFGSAGLKIKKKSLLLRNIDFKGGKNQVWMSHSDKIIKLPKDFELIAFTENSEHAVIQNLKKNFFGVQFGIIISEIQKSFLRQEREIYDFSSSITQNRIAILKVYNKYKKKLRS